MALGMSYSPLTDDETKNKPPNQEGAVQEAIRLLSLRMPTVQGAQAPASSQLLNAQGGGGLSPDALRRLLQMLASGGMGGPGPLGGSLPSDGLPPSAPPPSAPAPKVNYAPLPGSWRPPGPPPPKPLNPRPGPWSREQI